MDEKRYYLGFSLFPGVGAVTFGKLLNVFGSAKAAWNSSESDLQEVVGEKLTEKFVAFREQVDLAEEEKKLVQKNIQLVTLEDKEYPTILRELSSKNYALREKSLTVNNEAMRPSNNIHIPFLLYVKGDASILSSAKIIGIVGTRKITPYGKQVTEMLTQELVTQGFVTVSGLALGVDAMAHSATMRAGGKTIAVLGCGVDCCSPRENQIIYNQILEQGGAVVSTFPPGMEATKGSFPARNALIAGLSLGIVVTEGASDSGSLITANYAQKFGRKLFAVPGPITSMLSKGANSLLKQGAVAVTDASDILDKVGILYVRETQRSLQKGDTQEEQQILDLLQYSPLHFDEIVRRMKKDSKEIGSLLSLLELKEMIKSDASIYSLESNKQ